MLTLVLVFLILRYEEEFCLSEHSLIVKKEQEVGINCLYLLISLELSIMKLYAVFSQYIKHVPERPRRV